MLGSVELAAFVAALARLGTEDADGDAGAGVGDEAGGVDDAERVQQLGWLETVKSAAAAAQARVSVAFADSQLAAQRAHRTEPDRRLESRARARLGKGVGAQVALARRESPHRGGRHLGLARALVEEMPHLLAALSGGEVSEWQATLVVQATAVLTAEDRRAADVRLAGTLGPLNDAQVGAVARKVAYALDPAAFVRARARAVSQRRVGVRAAPEVMAYVSALVPAATGVAIDALLERHAATVRGRGDARSVGQIKADEFTRRLTGQVPDAEGLARVPDPVHPRGTDEPSGGDRATDHEGAGIAADVCSCRCPSHATPAQVPATDPALPVPAVAVNLVMTDAALFAGAHDGAYLQGYGPVPAQYARDLLAQTLARLPAVEQVRVRRLFTDPVDGALVAMDSTARTFTGALRAFVQLRDQTCRTPWCGAPIRQIDHVRPHARGGPTRAENGAGLCVACNQTKNEVQELPGWHIRTRPRAGAGRPYGGRMGNWGLEGPPTADPAPDLLITTPTGHTYRSTAPPLLDAAAERERVASTS